MTSRKLQSKSSPTRGSKSSLVSRKRLLKPRLENHPEFLRRVSEAREAIRAALGTRLEDLPR